MGTRIKTFVSTGVATAGRVYAGDLNAMMDQYADQLNLAQTVGVASLQVGESGLALSRFGAGEARISGALRTDGILRGLGGLFAGTFTTTQRNVISLPPFGLVILNTTTVQLEINIGTPSVPVWVGTGSDSAGIVKMTAVATAPSGWLLCDGAAISRATFSGLFTAIGTAYGVGDGSTTFNVPDYRGRVPVGVGTHADVSALGSSDLLAVGNRRPKHKHTITDNGHTHTVPRVAGVAASAPVGAVGGDSPGVTGSSVTGVLVGPQTGAEPTDTPAYQVINFIIKT